VNRSSEDKTESQKTPTQHSVSLSPSHSVTSSPRLFLIGPRGSGKSTVARLLAREMSWEWRDADAMLEHNYGQSIRTIFANEGEAGFRDKEAAVLAELCGLDQCVVATGGGVVLRESNRRLLRSSGRAVWLTASVDALWRRINADETTADRRPTLTVGGRAEIEEIVRIREPLYRQCADYTIDTTDKPAHEIVAEIWRWLASESA
jgi:shikimate kinase